MLDDSGKLMRYRVYGINEKGKRSFKTRVSKLGFDLRLRASEVLLTVDQGWIIWLNSNCIQVV